MAGRETSLLGDHTSSSFVFEIDGLAIGEFREVQGLEVHVDVVRLNEGGVNSYVHQLPGPVQWPNLVLRSGLTSGDNLFRWFEKTSGVNAGSRLQRSTGALTVLRVDGTRLRSWEFLDAFPVRWVGPRFSVDAGSMPVEELEIAHHGFKPKDGS